MGLDLVDAVINQLENVDAVTTAFGDTWDQVAQTGLPKFYTDLADQIPAPWCVLNELGESYDYMTAATGGAINFTSTGQLMFSIYASDRYQARQLGAVCAQALNDYPLAWPNENIMFFRLIRSQFNPLPSVGPGVPVLFNRVFFFEYTYSGSL